MDWWLSSSSQSPIVYGSCCAVLCCGLLFLWFLLFSTRLGSQRVMKRQPCILKEDGQAVLCSTVGIRWMLLGVCYGDVKHSVALPLFQYLSWSVWTSGYGSEGTREAQSHSISTAFTDGLGTSSLCQDWEGREGSVNSKWNNWVPF